jgi:transcription elongation factor Elf1
MRKTPKQFQCQFCGRVYQSTGSVSKFCSPKCRTAAYHERALENCKVHGRKYRRKIRQLWGVSSVKNHLANEVVKSELFVAQHILPKYGFTNILLSRSFSVYFPFDILARKDGRLCAINVTLQYSKELDPRLMPLIQLLDLRLFFCHVKPDFSKYYLLEIKPPKLHSSCLGVFLEEVEKA